MSGCRLKLVVWSAEQFTEQDHTLRWYALANLAPQPPSSKDLCVKLSPNKTNFSLCILSSDELAHP